MSDLDLDTLKQMPVPAPRADARKSTLDAAMQAFDAAAAAPSAGASTAATANTNSAEPPKDVIPFPRPMRSADGERKRPMLAQHKAALAASVALLVVGGPMALYIVAPQFQGAPMQPREALTAKKPVAVDAPVIAALPEPRATQPDRAFTERGRVEPVAPPKSGDPRRTTTVTIDKEGRVADVMKRPDAAQPRVEEAGRDADRARAEAEAKRKAADERRLNAVIHPRDPQRSADAAPPAAAAPPRVAALPQRVAPASPPVQERDGGQYGSRFRFPGEAKPDQLQRQQLGGGMILGDLKQPQHDKFTGFKVPDPAPQPQVEQGRDKFEPAPPNPVKVVTQEPVSTFSIDVDTASYSFVRRALNAGRLPQKDAVRVEEMINYFPYDYPRPEATDVPFRPTVTVMPSPWNADNRLVHIAIKGYDIARADRPRANLVLLVDVSGSMGPADRLPLLKTAFQMLVDNLQPEDTIAIVTYASGSDIRLPPTKVSDKGKIIAAIDSLRAGGSTHGAAGITDAYKVAEANFDKAAVNRVILATDGDWNVGITNRTELKSFIERKRESGVYLSILGVGMGNHNDQLMQTLAQNGNGVAAYIDTLSEARKVLVDEASSSLFPIAKDVKIQIEFNPALVSEYRLVGYETRILKREDFANDKVDAGDIGSGHSVTAIYEVTPVGAPRLVEDLRYGPQQPAAKTAAPTAAPPAPAGAPPREARIAPGSEYGFLKLRYKLPKEETSRLIELPITPAREMALAAAPEDVRFSVAVAAFGQLLKGQPYMKSYSFDDVIALANAAKGADPFGYRAEMINLARLAKSARP